MHWVIRWADEQDRDRSAVVEADGGDAARLIARGMGIEPILVARATQSDIAEARHNPVRWESAGRKGGGDVAPPRRGHTAFGRHVGGAQLAALMVAGVATTWLHLRETLPIIMS